MSYLGQEVVLRIKGNLTFIGKYMEDMEFKGDEGPLVCLDTESRVMIWCSQAMIEELIPLGCSEKMRK